MTSVHQRSHSNVNIQQDRYRQQQQYGPPKRLEPRPYPIQLENKENSINKSCAEEYLSTIINHYEFLETNSHVDPAMISTQPEVKWYMRPYLVNFIIQMHSALKLKSQTLFLCWNIIDRYCAKRIAYKQHYQLIGCTSLWIASKYEDKKSRVPTVQELSSMCSHVYEEAMFKEMEIHILSTLNWSIGHVTLEDILQLSVKFANHDNNSSNQQQQQQNKSNTKRRGHSPIVSGILAISRYLCELSLYDKAYLDFKPSLIAITAHLMACSILKVDTGYKSIESILTSYILNDFGLALNTPNSLNFPTSVKSNNNINKSSISSTSNYKSTTPTKANVKTATTTTTTNNSSNTTSGTTYGCDDELNDLNFIHCEFDDDQENDNNDNDTIGEYDQDDKENFQPSYGVLNGPFVSGFFGKESILDLRKISTLLFKSMNKPPEALTEKYTPLGVINAINQFFSENYDSLQNLSSLLKFDFSSSQSADFLLEFDQTHENSLNYLHHIELTDLLLSFPYKFETRLYNTLQSQRQPSRAFYDVLESPVSVSRSNSSFQTSPIMTSNSPSGFSSFASFSSQSTMSSHDDLIRKGPPSHIDHNNSIMRQNSIVSNSYMIPNDTDMHNQNSNNKFRYLNSSPITTNTYI